MNTTVTRYDTAFYVQALDRFVATGECAETDTEPLYAYLLSVMNDSMVKVQVMEAVYFVPNMAPLAETLPVWSTTRFLLLDVHKADT